MKLEDAVAHCGIYDGDRMVDRLEETDQDARRDSDDHPIAYM